MNIPTDALSNVKKEISNLDFFLKKISLISKCGNNIEQRAIFLKSTEIVFNDIDSSIEKLSQILKNELRGTASNTIREVSKLLNINNILFSDEQIKDNKKYKDLLIEQNLDFKKYKLEEVKEANQKRVFVHQSLNIISLVNSNFIKKVIIKEIDKDEIIKDIDFLNNKIKISKENLIRFNKDFLNLISKDQSFDIDDFKFSDLIYFFEAYKDKLSEYKYLNKVFHINLNLSINIPSKDIVLKVDKYKFLEIIETILFNGAEELCNKEIDTNSKEEKLLNVELYSEDEKLIIRIKDSGRGIPDTKKIFEMNYTTKKDRGGTGLGLSEALNIAQNLDVEIKVNTMVGKGSTFYIAKEYHL